MHLVPWYGFTVRGMSETYPLSEESLVPEACTLPTEEQPLRLAKFDELFANAVRGVHRTEQCTVRLELQPDAAVAAQTADLAMRETECCSFFTFTLTASGGALALDVSVPAEQAGVLNAFADWAATAVRVP